MTDSKADKDRFSIPLLLVKNLSVHYPGDGSPLPALHQVSLRVDPGETLGVVGESGCGKSTLAAAITRLLPENASIQADRLELGGEDLLALSEEHLQQLRGQFVAVVFQEPGSALSPLSRVGTQITEAIRHRRGMNRREAAALAEKLLAEVGIQDPKRCAGSYPHELSGGMLQRALIAAALAEDPQLLLADEPTTALDVSSQARVLRLLGRLRSRRNMSILLISHDLSVVAALADRVLVLYLGEVVEEASAQAVFQNPQHPYTRALLKSLPKPGRTGALPVIQGQVPSLRERPSGCPFHPRCPEVIEECREGEVAWVDLPGNQRVRCLRRPEEDSV